MIPSWYNLQAFNSKWLIDSLITGSLRLVWNNEPVLPEFVWLYSMCLQNGQPNCMLLKIWACHYHIHWHHLLPHFVLYFFPNNTEHSICPWTPSWNFPRFSMITPSSLFPNSYYLIASTLDLITMHMFTYMFLLKYALVCLIIWFYI